MINTVPTPPEGFYIVHSNGIVVDNPRDWKPLIHCMDCKYSVRPVVAGQMKCNRDGERWVFFDGYCDMGNRRAE